jgi:O-antigen ligase
MALLWFLSYCILRLFLGAWLAPGLADSWWPDTLEWLQFSLPWLWVAFNVLQYRGIGRHGLWALIAGCSVCALFHIAGIGVVDVPAGFDGRSTVFGENANVAGAMYAVAMIALVGLGMCADAKPMHRWLPLPLIAVLGASMAKTGSRTAVLILIVGILLLFFQRGTLGARAKRFATVLLVGAMLAGIVSAIPTVMQRFQMMDSSTIERQEGRVRMMPVLWEMFLRNPVHGSGPSDYQFELTRRAMPHLIQENRVIAAHNLALKLLVETGAVGFLLFAAGIKGALASAWRARVRPCGFLPLALLVPLLGAGLFLSDPSHHWVFWVAMAYALAGTA